MTLIVMVPMAVIFIYSIGCVAYLLLTFNLRNRISKPATNEPILIGPQFWLYDVTDYNISDQDVISGLGGRWISVRHEANEGAAVDHAAKVREITNAFISDGWIQKALPTHKYVLSEIYETSTDDLYFRRQARDDEPENWEFSNAIHVSSDGKIICTYCEVGW